jgi:transposase
VAAALAGKADDEAQVSVWVDQAGVYRLAHHVRTWARQGQTPVLRVPLTRDQRAAIAALTADQRLVMPTQTESSHRTAVVRFLRLLLRKIAGKLLMIWDGAPIHRGQPIKDFLAQGAGRRIHLEPLPGYAPDLTPVEGIWTYLNCRALGTVCCRDFAELDTALRRAKERLRHKHQVLRGCITECGYRIEPFIQGSVGAFVGLADGAARQEPHLGSRQVVATLHDPHARPVVDTRPLRPQPDAQPAPALPWQLGDHVGDRLWCRRSWGEPYLAPWSATGLFGWGEQRRPLTPDPR